jgi:uncharacterized membrane protein YsdA (DUF1294 family)
MPRPVKGRHPSPVLYHLSIALAVAALGALGLRLAAGGDWSVGQCVGAWLLAVNLTTFGYYGFDKARARWASRRVPELVLHALAVLGGSLGAFAGMQVFRHKTVKGHFRVVFWLIVAVQAVLIVWVVREVWWLRAARPAPAESAKADAFRLAAGAGRVK